MRIKIKGVKHTSLFIVALFLTSTFFTFSHVQSTSIGSIKPEILEEDGSNNAPLHESISSAHLKILNISGGTERSKRALLLLSSPRQRLHR